MTQTTDPSLEAKMIAAAEMLANLKHAEWKKFDEIKSQVEARVKESLAPVIDAIAASERICQVDLAVQINDHE